MSELKDYTEIQKEVSAVIKLLAKLEEGEQAARKKGWLTADEVEAALGL